MICSCVRAGGSSVDSGETDAANVELFTETMKLKGSSYH